MKNIMFAIFASLAMCTTAGAAGSISCEPKNIEEFPKNAKVKVEFRRSNIQMTVTTHFYGVDLDERYLVTQDGMVFTGKGVRLEISDELAPHGKGHVAILDDDKDGRIELFCQ